MRAELASSHKELATAKLAVAYTFLAMAPYDHWGHEGTPAEMATYVVSKLANEGKLGFLYRILEVGR